MVASWTSCEEHAAIMTHLESCDVEAAAEALEKHGLGGIEVVTGWIKQQEQKADSE